LPYLRERSSSEKVKLTGDEGKEDRERTTKKGDERKVFGVPFHLEKETRAGIKKPGG